MTRFRVYCLILPQWELVKVWLRESSPYSLDSFLFWPVLLQLFFTIFLGPVFVVLGTRLSYLSHWQPHEGLCPHQCLRAGHGPVVTIPTTKEALCMMPPGRERCLYPGNWLMRPTGNSGFIGGCLEVMEPECGGWEAGWESKQMIIRRQKSFRGLFGGWPQRPSKELPGALTCLEHKPL